LQGKETGPCDRTQPDRLSIRLQRGRLLPRLQKMCIFVTCIQLPKAELGYGQNERGLQAHVWSVEACTSTPRVNDAPVRRGRVAVPGYGKIAACGKALPGPTPPCNPCFLPTITGGGGAEVQGTGPQNQGITVFHQCSLDTRLRRLFFSDLPLQPMAPLRMPRPD
jgi:hypothetical protein